MPEDPLPVTHADLVSRLEQYLADRRLGGWPAGGSRAEALIEEAMAALTVPSTWTQRDIEDIKRVAGYRKRIADLEAMLSAHVRGECQGHD